MSFADSVDERKRVSVHAFADGGHIIRFVVYIVV